jgi:hypothetical protein
MLGLGSFSLFLFSSFDFEHHCIGLTFSCSEFWILWIFLCPPALHGHLRWLRIFFYAPQYCLGTFNHWGLFHAPQELFGHFQSLKIFCTCPPSIVWALSIIKDFFGTCPPSVGCDPSQCYFKKNALGSKGDFKGYILALWKDYQRWPFFISNACI